MWSVRPAAEPVVELVPWENVVTAFQDGEIVRATEALDPGTPRGQFQTREVDRRRFSRAEGLLSRPTGTPPYAWLVGREPGLFLDVLQPQDRELLLQVANGTSIEQRVAIRFNGVELGQRALPVGGAAESIIVDVPAGLQVRGRNRVTFAFDVTESRQLVGEPVALPIAGVVTNIRFAPPGLLGEPLPAPPVAGLITETGVDGPRSVLVVPPATSARVALELPGTERVVLRFRLTRLGTPLEVSLLDDSGVRTRLRTFPPSDSVPREVQFDLSPWAGQPVVLDFWAREGEGPAASVRDIIILVPSNERPVPAAAAPPLPPAPNKRPSFLVVTLDACARRRLGATPSPTPVLDGLVRRGISFPEATSAASYTLASVASLLTGQQPIEHGVALSESSGGVSRLARTAPGLAPELAAAGWRTAAFVTNPNAASRHGFDRGFESYDELFADPGLWEEGVAGEHLAPRLSRWLEGLGDAPFLAWVHVFEPHAPYDAPAELRREWVAPYDGPVRGDRAWIDAYRFTEVDVDAAGWRHLRELYAARLALADRHLGDLLAALEASGRADETVIVVTSDHGEAFGEHGLIEHGDTVFGEELEVPLVLVVPGRAAASRRGPATTADIAPTLLRLAGLTVPAPMTGSDLLGAALDPDRPLLARSAARRPMLSWTRDRWKIVVDTETRQVSLFDLTRDPFELRDVYDEHPARAALLHRELSAAVCRQEQARGPAEAAAGGDALIDEQLASIGYASRGAPLPEADSLCRALREPLRRL